VGRGRAPLKPVGDIPNPKPEDRRPKTEFITHPTGRQPIRSGPSRISGFGLLSGFEFRPSGFRAAGIVLSSRGWTCVTHSSQTIYRAREMHLARIAALRPFPVRVSVGKATQSHLKAIPKPVDGQPIATPKPPQSHPKATPKPLQSHMRTWVIRGVRVESKTKRRVHPSIFWTVVLRSPVHRGRLAQECAGAVLGGHFRRTLL